MAQADHGQSRADTNALSSDEELIEKIKKTIGVVLLLKATHHVPSDISRTGTVKVSPLRREHRHYLFVAHPLSTRGRQIVLNDTGELWLLDDRQRASVYDLRGVSGTDRQYLYTNLIHLTIRIEHGE